MYLPWLCSNQDRTSQYITPIMFVLYFYNFYIIGIDLPDVLLVHCEVTKELFLLHLPHPGISRLLLVIQLIVYSCYCYYSYCSEYCTLYFVKTSRKKVSVANKVQTGDN